MASYASIITALVKLFLECKRATIEFYINNKLIVIKDSSFPTLREVFNNPIKLAIAQKLRFALSIWPCPLWRGAA